MLRPARWLGRLTSPRQRCAPTGPPVYGRACPVRGLPQPESAITTRPNHLLPRRDSHPLAYQRTKAAPGANRGHRGTLLWLESQGLEISRVGLGRTDTAAHVSPVPSIHSVRWVFPSTVGRRLSPKPGLPFQRFARLHLTVPRSDLVQGSGSPCGQSPYSLAGAFVSAVPQALGSARFIMSAPANATTA